jgi:hypothetical protein
MFGGKLEGHRRDPWVPKEAGKDADEQRLEGERKELIKTLYAS